jgi:hypothetical protein
VENLKKELEILPVLEDINLEENNNLLANDND